MLKITVTKRANGIRAYFENEEDQYALGRTTDEAVGNLIRSHQERSGVQIEWAADEVTQQYVSSRSYP